MHPPLPSTTTLPPAACATRFCHRPRLNVGVQRRREVEGFEAGVHDAHVSTQQLACMEPPRREGGCPIRPPAQQRAGIRRRPSGCHQPSTLSTPCCACHPTADHAGLAMQRACAHTPQPTACAARRTMQRHRVDDPEAVGPHAFGVIVLSQHQRDLRRQARAIVGVGCMSGRLPAGPAMKACRIL